MPLSEAVSTLHQRLGADAERRGDADVHDATHDSRQVRPGWLFCAVVGATADGHRFAPTAVEGGAAALLVERWLDDLDVPQVRVPSVRAAMGPVAARIHGDPSTDLTVVGTTGTNGKTTVSYLLEAVFGHAAMGTGIIGTIETRIHGEPEPGVRTTPESTDLQRLLATMRARGVDAVAMEVSSHGLDQHRVDGTRFDCAVFTNLSQDHLDYHGTMEAYYAAKAAFFTPAYAHRGIVCVDDEWGRRLAEEAAIPVTTYGTATDADVHIRELHTDLDGTRAVLATPDGEVEVETRLLGGHNGLNATAAYLAAVAVGIHADVARAGVAACPGVPGRLERVERGQPFAVLVDYAHTPDALAHVVEVCRDLGGEGSRLHVVIGCGGDRDRGKRPEMGRIAASSGGRAVLTSDNPRSEDPDAIIGEMLAGADTVAGAEIVVEPDRRTAIRIALEGATTGDVVLIAGKGHETYQEFADHTIDFDDREVAAEALAALGHGRQLGGAA